jgi:hypothetical protein
LDHCPCTSRKGKVVEELSVIRNSHVCFHILSIQ